NGSCTGPSVHLTWRDFQDPTQIFIRQGSTYMSSILTAALAPTGGTVNWYTTDPQVLEIQASGTTVTIKGLKPGLSTLFLGYSYNGQNVGTSVLIRVIYPIIFVHGINSGADTWSSITSNL